MYAAVALGGVGMYYIHASCHQPSAVCDGEGLEALEYCKVARCDRSDYCVYCALGLE